FFQLSPCCGSSQELKKKKLQYLLRMVQISDCSRYGPRQQHLTGTFQDAAGGERNLRGDQGPNSF
ncbi:hypothetical protein N338_03441, partial [Podiceps cristatus]